MGDKTRSKGEIVLNVPVFWYKFTTKRRKKRRREKHKIKMMVIAELEDI